MVDKTPPRTSRPPRAARPSARRQTLAEELAGAALEAFVAQLPAEVRAALEGALPDEGLAGPWARAEGEVADAIDARLRARVDDLLEGRG